MNIKKLVSIIVFPIIGFSFVHASEDSISIIKNSNIENIRGVGYELCKIYTKHGKSNLEALWDYVWGIRPEEMVARSLMNHHDLIDEIFSGKESNDSIVKELQEGCFDFLMEDSLFHAKEFYEKYKNEGYQKNLRCWTADEAAAFESNELEGNFSSLDLKICNDTQLSLLKEVYNLAEKSRNATTFPYKLMKLLGLADRIKELRQKDEDLQMQYGLIIEVDTDDKIEL